MIEKKYFSKIIFAFLLLTMLTSIFATPVIDTTKVVENSPENNLDLMIISEPIVEELGYISERISSSGSEFLPAEIVVTEFSGGSNLLIRNMDSIRFFGGDYSNPAKAILDIPGTLCDYCEDSSLIVLGIPIELGNSRLSKVEIAQKISDEVNLKSDLVNAKVININNNVDVEFTMKNYGEGTGTVLFPNDDLSYFSSNQINPSSYIMVNHPYIPGKFTNDLEFEGILINLGKEPLSKEEVAQKIYENLNGKIPYGLRYENNYVLIFSEKVEEFETLNGQKIIANDLLYTTPTYPIIVLEVSSGLEENAKDSMIIFDGVEIDLGQNSLSPSGIVDKINSYGYSFTQADTNSFFMTSDILGETIDFTNEDFVYTSKNSVEGIYELYVNDGLVDNALDQKIIIDNLEIDLGIESLTNDEIASLIVEQNFENIVTSVSENVVKITSENSISYEDLILDSTYGGQKQISELTLGDFEEGFTYDLNVNNNVFYDIVTPKDTSQFMIIINELINNVEGISSSLLDNTITIIGDDTSTEFNLEIVGLPNTKPYVENVRIEGTLNVGDVISCEYDFIDLENNVETNSIVNWYKDSNLILDFNSKVYEINDADIGSSISCSVTPKTSYGVKQGELNISENVEIPLAYVNIFNGAFFSVPTCVDSQKMIETANLDDTDLFISYTSGMWESFNGNFEVLKGYKYFGTKDFDFKLFPSSECDFTQVRTSVKNDWNLLGLNSMTNTNAGNFLWSLTKRSTSETLIDALYDGFGSNLGLYTMNNFENIIVEPTKAYWVFYAGDDEDVFSGASYTSELEI